MKLLAIDTSSQSACCAIWRDGVLLGEFFGNVKLTHSQTILPMTQCLLEQTRMSLGDMDAFAVTTGPGSFTGLRIGISAVKGMAYALDKPCIPVSTLEALAWSCAAFGGYIAPVLDARCSQVYTALFSGKNGQPVRLGEDEAISIEMLINRLKNLKERVFLVGDGAQMCYNKCIECGLPVFLPSPAVLYARAGFAAQAAAAAYEGGKKIAAGALAPAYLRLPQAQRQLQQKQQGA